MQEFLAALENPDAHAAQWSGLPAYAGAAAPTMQSMQAVQPPKPEDRDKRKRTLALSDAPPATAGGSPRPTTLEGAAAEVTLPPTRVPRNRAPLIAVAAAVLALAGVGGWLGLSKKSSSTETPAASAPPQPEPPKTLTPPPADEVTIVVASDPLGAKVYRADKSEAETQPTPITFKMHRGDPPFDIQLRAEGYVPQTRTITSDESAKLLVPLAKLPIAAPKVEPPPPQPKVVAKPVKAPKPVVTKVSDVPKPIKKPGKSAPKDTPPDPDGIIQPSFGN
jgi:hypothetical protein